LTWINAGIAVLARAGRPMAIKEIAEACKKKYDNVKKLLAVLEHEGHVTRVQTGIYKLPDPQEQIPF
jgi:DNA-binding IclR family transcriptional regulator